MRTITITIEDDSADKLIASVKIPMHKFKNALTPSLILSVETEKLEKLLDLELKRRGKMPISFPDRVGLVT